MKNEKFIVNNACILGCLKDLIIGIISTIKTFRVSVIRTSAQISQEEIIENNLKNDSGIF